jgi:hypothetical protein
MNKEFFDNNVSKFQAEDDRLSGLFNRISTIRIATFVVALIMAVYFADVPNATALGLVVLIFLISFVVLVKWHNRVKYERNHARFLRQINEQELARLRGDLSSFDGGEEFNTIDHPYSGDLDVFGRNSLFQLLNRTTTIIGRKRLADWLLEPAASEAILRRQAAISELKDEQGFCQNFQAKGLHFQDKKVKFEPLIAWLKEPIVIRSNKWLMSASYVLPLMSLVLLIGISLFDVPFGYLLLVVLVNGVLLKRVFPYSMKITDQTSHGVSTLASISQLTKEVEQASFTAPLLVEIKNDFSKDGVVVSKRVNGLVKILDFLNARANMMYMGVNVLFLLDIHLISQAEKWKVNNQNDVKNWFDRISEFEVLCSLSGYYFANADYTMPTIVEQPYKFSTSGMAHPLIKSVERIANDFEAEHKGSVMIVTGSNMSGKSTFLRTVGVNIVLALAGAPVCAESMSLSRMLVFTSMRTQDNLEEHISSFYAELKRIKQLLDLLEENELPTLFMLDEILKGTNSLDRHKGALAILKQLHKTNAFGFISTHDLELGQEAKKLQYCENYSFNSEIVADKILFDYKIDKRICHSFNASALMKNIGIEID